MDMLVLARDGDHARLGPHSLGPPARFVVDHAPCQVLLVWADAPPAVTDHPARPRRIPRRCRTSTRCARRCAPIRARRSAHIGGDAAFRIALRALLHRAARPARARSTATIRASRSSGARLLDAIARTAAARDRRAARARPRARDHPGLAAARAGGRLRRLRRPLRRHARRRARAPALPARARRQLPAPDAAAARAAGAERRRLRGRRLRRGRACARHDGRPARAGRRAARRRHGAVHRPRAQPHRAPSTRGRRRRSPATRERWPSTARSRTAPSPTPTSARCPRSSPTPRPANFTWSSPRSAAGCGRRSTPTSGTSTTPTPRSSRAMAEAMLGLAGGRRRRAAPRRGAVPVEAAGHQLPEPARGPRAAAGVPRGRCGSPRRRSPSRPRRSSRRATSSPTSARAATRARSATSPTTTCSWCCSGARWPPGGCALLTHTLRRDAAASRPAPAGSPTCAATTTSAGRSRDEDAARGRRGRPPAPALPGRLLRRRVPGHVRARRALPARPGHRRGAHERDGRVARRAGGGARARRRVGARARAPAHPAALRGGLRPRRPAARSTWATSSACATTTAGRRSAHGDDNRWMHRPPMDWAAAERRARPGERSRAACGPGCGG